MKSKKELAEIVKDKVESATPVQYLPDGSVVYKNYKVVSNSGNYKLTKLSSRTVIDTFKTKSAAILAAKFYDQNNFNNYSNIKHIDQVFFSNFVDAEIFRFRIKNTKDLDRRDLMQWRLEIAESRAQRYKHEITALLKTHL